MIFRPIDVEYLGLGQRRLYFLMFNRGFQYAAKVENHWLTVVAHAAPSVPILTLGILVRVPHLVKMFSEFGLSSPTP